MITVTLILLVRPFSANLNGYSSYYRDVFGHRGSLCAWLTDEEARCAVAVQERLELIKNGDRGMMLSTRECRLHVTQSHSTAALRAGSPSAIL